MQVYSVRGVPPASPGDGSEFGKALEAAADKKIDTLLEGVDKGLSPAEAAAQADKALGKTDPQSNFSALNPGALRRVEGTNPGDGSIFDKVIDKTVERFWGAVGAAEEQGASEQEAEAAGNKAIGKIDPQANFSAVVQWARERTDINGVALRGRDEPSRPDADIPEVHYNDRDTFGSAINATADKQAKAYEEAAQSGASSSEAQDAANEAVGKSDPQANFSARRPMLSSLAAALRRSRPHSELHESEPRRRPILRPRMA
ncbi:MAG TPA: hypothetical protein VHC91_24370 [Trinickia sp.]|uniref:hypothetical protein n=1 Tax=Trinickia sp. TaxID=2571163 RepID=UPI002CD5E0A5|nr:hypothetical protein [Trinickia sp.]HVW53506.1 hypothetical protein [Trinickia sp.]